MEEENNKLNTEVLKEPFRTAFEKGQTIDYISNDCADHKYVEKLGYQPSMNSDCSYTSCGLKSFSLSSYGDWGSFYTDSADTDGKKMFLDMVEKSVIIPWRIRC